MEVQRKRSIISGESSLSIHMETRTVHPPVGTFYNLLQAKEYNATHKEALHGYRSALTFPHNI